MMAGGARCRLDTKAIGCRIDQPLSGSPEPLHLHLYPGKQAGGWHVAAPLTSILGRDAEIDAVVAQLDRGEVRLVTLTGPGGIGKTRLVREVALRMQEHFAHGACFVALAAVPDPTLVPSAMASALGLQLLTDRPAEELVSEAPRDRHVLLVLDNLEHLAEQSAPWVVALLEQCPRVSALATSRVPLRIAGEHRFPVDPLALPEDRSGPEARLETIAESAADDWQRGGGRADLPHA
ncbi:MAG TPA: AAA family ATPase [Thermomicrobiales bacterium]|nr:AAA family ATPase [Thermomicrobiales bacterium]